MASSSESSFAHVHRLAEDAIQSAPSWIDVTIFHGDAESAADVAGVTTKDYFHWLKGPIKKLMKEIAKTPSARELIARACLPAIPVPRVGRHLEDRTITVWDYAVVSPGITIKEFVFTPEASERIQAEKWEAFLRKRPAHVFMVLCRGSNLVGAKAAHNPPSWPGGDKLRNEEHVVFERALVAAAMVVVSDIANSEEKLRRRNIEWILAGLEWLEEEVVGPAEPAPEKAEKSGPAPAQEGGGKATRPDDLTTTPVAVRENDTSRDSIGRRTKQVRPPSVLNRKIARAYEAGELTQVELAQWLTKKLRLPITQQRVSAAVNAENQFRRASPDLGLAPIETRKRRIPTMDPKKLDMGPRQDHRSERQRQKPSN